MANSSFQPQGRHGLAVLLFTDIVDSVELQHRIGTQLYAGLLRRHDAVFREMLGTIPGAEVINHTGDGFLARLDRSSDAVQAALRFHYLLRTGPHAEPELSVRIGLHQGEILEEGTPSDGTRPGAVGMAVNLAARIMGLAQGGQILLTRPVFDEARLYVREHPPAEGGAERPTLEWMAHGPYLLKGSEEPVEIFEVGARELAPLRPPPDSDKAVRSVAAEDAATLGWRPASGLEIPRRNGWRLTDKLGEGGFGEVWLARQVRTHEQRVFKFCFDPVRLRSFKRELTLFRLIRDALGKRDDIATLHEVQVEAPPFYLESDFCEGGNLRQWADRAGGIQTVPPATRHSLMVRICRAVAAAHSLGIIHRDIKPSNVFINDTENGPRPRLADFGIGVLSDMDKASGYDVTLTGFTQQTLNRSETAQTGTKVYSAPEYLIGKPPTMQGDVYALGVLLYQMMSGDLHRPLGSGWERDVTDPLLREDIALAVDVDPARRLASAAELADRLESLEQRHAAAEEMKRLETQAAAAVRHRRRLRWLLAASAAGVLLTAGTIWLAIREAHRSRELEAAGQSAESARAVAVQSVGSLQTGTGTMRGDTGDVSLGALWMASAVRTADGTEAAPTARIRFRNYAQSAPFSIAAISPEDGVWVRRIVFHPHRSRLLLESGNGRWELHDLDPAQRVDLPGASPQTAAAWDPKGEHLYLADGGNTLRMIDDASGKTLAETAVGEPIAALAVSGDGAWLAAAGRSLSLFRIDSANSQPRLTPVGEPLALDRAGAWVAFSPDTSALAVASIGRPGRVQVFTLHSEAPGPVWQPAGTVPHHLLARSAERPFQPPVFLPDRRLVVFSDGLYPALAGWTAGTLALEDNTALKVAGNGNPLVSMAVTTDGHSLAVGGFRYFSLVDPISGRETQPPSSSGHDVVFTGFTPGGTHLVTASNDGRVSAWRRGTQTQTLLRRWHAASGAIDSAALSPDGTLLAVADSSGPLVRVWSSVFGCPPAAAATFEGLWSRLAVSPSGKLFVPSGSTYKNSDVEQIAVYDTESFKAVGPMWRTEVSPQAAVFSADEQFVFTAGGTPARALLQKWDFRSGREAAPPLALRGATAAMALSPDGKHVAVYLRNGSLLIVSTDELKQVAAKAFSRPSNSFYYFYNGLLTWHRDSDLLAVASTDGRAALFRFEAGGLALQGQAIEVGSNLNVFLPAPDGRHWVAGGNDAKLRAWDMQTGQPAPLPVLSQPDWTFGATFTADGKEVLTTCRDGFARVWNWGDGRRLYPSAAVPNEVYFGHWLPGDVYYATGGADTTVRLWEKKTGQPLMPPLFTGVWPMLSLEMAADSRVLLTTGRSPWASAVRLAEWLEAPTGGVGEMEEFAEVMANTRLMGSNEERLSPGEWIERWKRVQSSEFYRREKTMLEHRTAAWHRMEYQLCRMSESSSGMGIHAAAMQRSGDEAVLRLRAEELDARSRQDPSVLPEVIAAWRALVAQFPEAIAHRTSLAGALARSGDLEAAWKEVRVLLAEIPENDSVWELAESCASASSLPTEAWRGLRTAVRSLRTARPSLEGVAAATALDGPERTLAAAATAVDSAPQDQAVLDRYAAALACATCCRTPRPPAANPAAPTAAPPGAWVRLFLVLRSMQPSTEPDSAHWTGRHMGETQSELSASREGTGLAFFPETLVADGEAVAVLLRPAGEKLSPPDQWQNADFSADAAWDRIKLPLCLSSGDLESDFTDRLRGATAVWMRQAFRLPVRPGPLCALNLRLKGSDGWAVWLNGTELARVRLPEGSLGPDTVALTPGKELAEYEVPLPITRQDGENTLCIALFVAPGSPNPLDCHPALVANDHWLTHVFPRLTPADTTRLFADPEWPVPAAIREKVQARLPSKSSAGPEGGTEPPR